MNHDALTTLLEALQQGRLPLSEAVTSLTQALANSPSASPARQTLTTNHREEDLGFAVLDHERATRKGMPEVIFGAGKSAEHIAVLLERIHARGHHAFATRVDEDKAALVLQKLPQAEWHASARALVLRAGPTELTGRGKIMVITAGTSDLPVADEAALTAELFGNEVVRVTDVGVAGLHRLLNRLPLLREAEVLIVVAGMEGALPSVVAGLVSRPVIAVPTSIGYGASFGGLAALLGMLNSCASGVTVVNIDNGFGAGYAASLMNRKSLTL